ncbi:hypothetical protein ISN35_04415 [Xanthomonas translucens pv. undulosa]|uniref:hypothetical protein n=1 Tax=Xanthomonas campestris pv. translucens TaxID=343 RepID=UPI0019D65231|nr:hypothetical protein [Xanthomonas translucens]QSQ42280.1 hypothetical protein ISN33_03405 [Xanthomonas translucens pv. translucens]QSQ49873.1 hypothetical protein ISN35_04415 [Xanthomonas translucens pv. undulosa]
MSISSEVIAPKPSGGPDKDWPHRDLYDRVVHALYILPSRFRTKLRIAGVAATDLFTLNTPLGAAIEQNVVENLNELRPLWDPDQRYESYSFVRQPQAFPDVRLQSAAPESPDRIIMGIELKGWFVLSKEGEPSFRYKISSAACQPQDLLAVFPWQLDEVISGTPQLMRPYITEAKYAAEHRNYYWEHVKGAGGSVKVAEGAAPYPLKNDKFNDVGVPDAGGNFGRVARGGLMSDFIEQLLLEQMSGIPAKHWQAFLKIFSDGANADSIDKKLLKIKNELTGDSYLVDPELDNFLIALKEFLERRSN